MKHPWSSPEPEGNPCARTALCCQDFLLPGRLTYLWATMAASPEAPTVLWAHPLQASGLGPAWPAWARTVRGVTSQANSMDEWGARPRARTGGSLRAQQERVYNPSTMATVRW